MKVDELVDKYFDKIEIEDTDYVPFNEAKSYAAHLLLTVPIQMLVRYLKLKKQKRRLPDGAEFWRETNLCKRLRNSDKYHGQGHENLEDILDYLEGNVQVGYEELHVSDRIRLSVIEIPKEFY